MGGLSRYDFFRIVLPGALVLFLADIGIRIVSGGDRIGLDDADRWLRLLEEPATAIVLALGVGLFLYFVDPGYGAPQYYVSIPSVELEKLVKDAGYKLPGSATSFYFVVADSIMPADLKERALLYGAFYRVAFQAILYTLLLGASIGPTVSLLVASTHNHSFTPRSGSLAAAVIVAVALAVPFIRELLKERKRQRWPKRRFVLLSAIAALIPSVLWVNLGTEFLRPALHSEALAASFTGLVAAIWSLLRLSGPIRNRWAHLHDPSVPKPDKPHKATEIAVLDAMLVVPGFIALLAVDDQVTAGGVALVAALNIAGLVLSFLRKHERQLFGIYKNQTMWMELHLQEIVARYGLSKSAATPSDTPEASST